MWRVPPALVGSSLVVPCTIIMARKTAFVHEMILKTLNQHQQTITPAVQKAATLDYEVGEILNWKNVNDHDKAKRYSDILQKYLGPRKFWRYKKTERKIQ